MFFCLGVSQRLIHFTSTVDLIGGFQPIVALTCSPLANTLLSTTLLHRRTVTIKIGGGHK